MPDLRPITHSGSHIAHAILAAILFGCCMGCANGDDPSRPNEVAAATQQAKARDPALSPELGRIFRIIQEGRPDRARLHLQRHILENPDDGQALFLFGLTFHVQHRYDQARIHFRNAVDMVPDYPPLHYFHGWCLYNLGELDEARTSFETQLRLQPGETDAIFALGLIALDQDRLDDARDHLTQTIARYEEGSGDRRGLGRAHGKLGEALLRSGDLQQARQHLTIAAELYPDDHESLYQLYRVLMSLDEPDAAEDARRRHVAARQRANLPGEPATP